MMEQAEKKNGTEATETFNEALKSLREADPEYDALVQLIEKEVNELYDAFDKNKQTPAIHKDSFLWIIFHDLIDSGFKRTTFAGRSLHDFLYPNTEEIEKLKQDKLRKAKERIFLWTYIAYAFSGGYKIGDKRKKIDELIGKAFDKRLGELKADLDSSETKEIVIRDGSKMIVQRIEGEREELLRSIFAKFSDSIILDDRMYDFHLWFKDKNLGVLDEIAGLSDEAFKKWESEWFQDMLTLRNNMAQQEVDNVYRLIANQQLERSWTAAVNKGYKICKEKKQKGEKVSIQDVAGKMVKEYFPEIQEWTKQMGFEKSRMTEEFKHKRDSIRQGIRERLRQRKSTKEKSME